MRRIAAIPCRDGWLMATLEGPHEATEGFVFVVGGRQTRVGPHRLYERLAAKLAASGRAVIRFDRAGVGDSPGEDRGFADSAPDIAAAAAALRQSYPAIQRIAGFGLCDGATALALHGKAIGIDTLILANPWAVEPTDDLPPAAAIRGHYARRLFDPAAWGRLVRGGIDLPRLVRGIARSTGRDDASLARRMADGMPAYTIAVLTEQDGTAQAFESIWSRLPDRPPVEIVRIATTSHTFAEPAAFAALADALTLRR